MNLVEVFTEKRVCECCRGEDLESLWYHEMEVPTRNGGYRFRVNNAICRECGFVFVSPVATKNALERYYSDSYGIFSEQEPDYDPVIRVSLIKKHAAGRSSFVEIGSNRPSIFHDEMRSLGLRYEAVELNNQVNSAYRSINEVPPAYTDVVAHYFVLEHIPDVFDFLSECYRVLKKDGIMFCEVPDIEVYPDNPVALQLVEHTNHFSLAALEAISRRAGFELIDTAKASRSFGFAAAFRKLDVPVTGPSPDEYAKNKRLFMGGLEALTRRGKILGKAANDLEDYVRQQKPVIFWAANAMALEFFQQFTRRDIVVIDSDPQKKNYFHDLEVRIPAEAKSEIESAKAIFIFSNNHWREIVASIKKDFGKAFDVENIHVVDYLTTR